MAARLAALIFLLAGGAHLYRYYQKLEAVIGDMIVPVDWSLYAGGVCIVMALWLWVSSR